MRLGSVIFGFLFMLLISLAGMPVRAENDQISLQKRDVLSMNSPDSEKIRAAATYALDRQARRYVLGPNDVLSIGFLGAPDLNIDMLKVGPDGRINLAPIGLINASGKTLEELQAEIERRADDYLVNPSVSVNLRETRPFIVYIKGAVINPGSYEMSTNTEKSLYSNTGRPELQIERKAPLLSNVLVAAGGITYDADLEHVKIVNQLDSGEFEVNLLGLLDPELDSRDLYLISGDTVIIPRKPTPLAVAPSEYAKFASASFSPREVTIRVYGYVKNPGPIRLDASQPLTLSAAIVGAGGYTAETPFPPEKIYISRRDVSGRLVTRTVNPLKHDEPLLPNEIVYVPEKVRLRIGKAFDYTSRMIAPFSLFGGAYNSWSLIFNPHRFQVAQPIR